jgi:hypothetical protein
MSVVKLLEFVSVMEPYLKFSHTIEVSGLVRDNKMTKKNSYSVRSSVFLLV